MDIISKFRLAIPTGHNDEAKLRDGERTVIQIPLHAIKTNPCQPRRIFDNDSIQELAESVRKYGVIQPITVRKIDSDMYELIAGERRLRACSLAGMLKIPAIVTDLSDNDSAVVALVENIQRENLSYMEEAEAYRNLLYNHGFTQDELAKKLGKTQSSIANKVRLLKLSLVVREIIKDNMLTERHARALLRLENENDRIKALEKITDQNLNVQQTDELIEEMLHSPREREKERKITIKRRPMGDVRIFTNTLKKAVDVMKNSGINATSTENEFEDYLEYIIHIPKKQ